MTRETVRLAWQPEVGDYLDAFKARNRVNGAWRKVGVLSLAGAVFAVGAFVLGHSGAAAVGVEIAVLLPLVVQPITWLSTRSLWKRQTGLRAPSSAVVDPQSGITFDGAVVDMSGGQAMVTREKKEWPWPSVERVLETDRVFVVHLAGHRGKRFVLLAKRGVADPGALGAALGAR